MRETDFIKTTTQVFGDLRKDGFRLHARSGASGNASPLVLDSQSLLLCVNLPGGVPLHLDQDGKQAPVKPGQVLVTAPRGRGHIEALDSSKQRYVALQMRRVWLKKWLLREGETSDLVRGFLSGDAAKGEVREVRPVSPSLENAATRLLEPPASLWLSWSHAKALEILTLGLEVPSEEEFFCERTRRIGRERVERVKQILRADLENPPPLGELGRMVGCSPFYLSRTFRQEMGLTISAYLRSARLERAAELLRDGRANVTEAAMTVGYSSLSHFSKAFAEAFGCCPCLYGRRPAGSEITRGAA